MESLTAWLSANVETLQRLGGLWLGVGLVSLALTVVALPMIVIRLPADYFVREQRLTVAKVSTHPVPLILIRTLKNVVGIALILLGAIMLFVPGQGVLTMLIGLMLANFPGKYHLEQKLIRRPSVLRTLNRVRKKAGREPLVSP